jgi:hypothetical protein
MIDNLHERYRDADDPNLALHQYERSVHVECLYVSEYRPH